MKKLYLIFFVFLFFIGTKISWAAPMPTKPHCRLKAEIVEVQKYPDSDEGFVYDVKLKVVEVVRMVSLGADETMTCEDAYPMGHVTKSNSSLVNDDLPGLSVDSKGRVVSFEIVEIIDEFADEPWENITDYEWADGKVVIEPTVVDDSNGSEETGLLKVVIIAGVLLGFAAVLVTSLILFLLRFKNSRKKR